jgi:hypothetical protein
VNTATGSPVFAPPVALWTRIVPVALAFSRFQSTVTVTRCSVAVVPEVAESRSHRASVSATHSSAAAFLVNTSKKRSSRGDAELNRSVPPPGVFWPSAFAPTPSAGDATPAYRLSVSITMPWLPV